MKRSRKTKRNYTYRTMRDEREYGLYWYSGLWNILRPILIACATLVVVIGLIYTGWTKIYDGFLSPMEPGSTEEVGFTVENGQSLTKVSNNLEAAGLIHNRSVFKYYCDFAGMGQKIQAGSYKLTRSMTMSEIADQLTTGDGNPIVRNITLIPGWTVEDFAEKLASDGVIADKAAFLELCKTGDAFTDYYYIADVKATANASKRRYILEGYLAPNTYEVYMTATDEEILRKLLSQTEAVFPADYQTRATELGMTMDEVITLASLIEKEAKAADFTKVSAVFHNRLKINMALGSDVTIKYVTGTERMSLNNSDLSVDSPYNTYRNKGLPPGPICNPSAAAIEAALYPDETFTAQNYLYFCSKDPATGELYFSRTLEEHEAAVKIYAPLWQAYDEKTGAK